MTRVADFEVDPARPMDPIEVLAIETKVMMEQDIRDAMEELSQRLWQSIHWAFVPANRRAAEVVAQQWGEWMSALLSDEEVVEIDVTAFLDDPDAGQGGDHVISLVGLLTTLSNRQGATWRDKWEAGKPWIACFGPRREEDAE